MRSRWILAAMLLFVGSSLAAALSEGGANFDFLKDEDRKVLQERFVKDIYPMMLKDGKNGCVGCHSGKIVSSLKMSGDAEKDFRMLVKDGFFIPNDAGSVLTRVQSKDRKRRMPPPGKGDPWTKEEMEVLNKFVLDVEAKQQKKSK
jgi:hypothetical protein